MSRRINAQKIKELQGVKSAFEMWKGVKGLNIDDCVNEGILL